MVSLHIKRERPHDAPDGIMLQARHADSLDYSVVADTPRSASHRKAVIQTAANVLGGAYNSTAKLIDVRAGRAGMM
jgi:hypothetical protein